MNPTLLDSYAPLSGRHDELMAADGSLRPHWSYLANALSALAPRQLAERRWELQRLLVEHGIYYNVYGRDGPRQRPWPMDLLPLLITSREWREIEVGIVQRAELLRQILHDLYGEQKLLKRGLLPAELVYGDRRFLLPCTSATVPLEHALVVYAADLGRAPDGRLWVTGDRCQAPSGIGYALAARTISSRVLPSLFRESSVHPVLPFLRTLRNVLVGLAGDEPGRVALLSPGPANETYGEQAYLARHLGLALVEGADLAVRRGRLWMLDAEERQPLTVLLRRMDDDFCDPLELNRRSLLGTPGLLQAVRNRHLICANPLGNGVMENPGLLPFLPRICRELLGEDLRLPSRDSWWCGRKEDLWYVERHFDEMLLQSCRGAPGDLPVAVARLGRRQRESLLERVRAEPQAWAAQQATAQGCAPVLQRNGIVGKPFELRTFAVCTRDSFQVMSGGLARAGRNADSWRFSSQLGGVSKDVWVLASEPQRDVHTLPELLPRLPRPHKLGAPHIAENLIWFGRYRQRAELLSRMLRLALERSGEPGSPPREPAQVVLLQALTWQSTVYPGFIGPLGGERLADPEPELLHLVTGDDDGCLRQTVKAMVDAAEPVRDLLPPEADAQLGALANELPRAADGGQARPVAERVYLLLCAIGGQLQRAMPDDSVRSLIDIGELLESALGTVRLLRSILVQEAAATTETVTLAFEIANTRPLNTAGVPAVSAAALLHSLLLSDVQPQSVRAQLMRLERQLRSLRPAHAGARPDALEAEVAARLSKLGTLDAAPLLAACAPGQALDVQLDELHGWLSQAAQRVTARYTPRRAAPPTQLVQTA